MAHRNKRTVCFIDDDPAELNRFLKAFREDFNVITASSYIEATKKLNRAGRRSPDLWVLDLYFPISGRSNSPEQLHYVSARFEAFDRARRGFLSYLQQIGQDKEGGLKLLARCKQNHRAPVVMFTRKGTIDDAIDCLSRGAAEILKKPMPPKLPTGIEERAAALDDALVQAKGGLADRFAAQIVKNSYWVRNRARYLAIATFILGILIDRALEWIGL